MSRSRLGLTLIEVLVVLAIIGILLAIIIPAVQSAREASRRTQCVNNVKQLALGLQNYHTTHGMFPINYGVGDYNDNNRGASWIAMMLPEIGQPSLFQRIQFGSPVTDTVNDVVSTTVIPSLLCPSDVHGNGVMPNRRGSNKPRAITNYKGCLGSNWGWGTFAGEKSQKGRNSGKTDGLEMCNGFVCRNGDHPPFTTTSKDLTDGTSQTLVLGEAVPEWTWHTWWFSFNGCTGTTAIPPNHFRTPEDTLDDWQVNYSFASRHKGGIHVAFADGHAKFLAETVDLPTYRALATIQGGEKISEDGH